jgi:hypothetical protein
MTYGSAGSDENEHPAFDNVFANPTAYDAFMQTGSWPERAVLVLETRHSESQASINRGGYFQTDASAVEAHVKDSTRFGKDGWGFFAFENSTQPAKLLPLRMNCYSCHREHGAVDTTFVQFYPTLLEVARQKGTLRASY